MECWSPPAELDWNDSNEARCAGSSTNVTSGASVAHAPLAASSSSTSLLSEASSAGRSRYVSTDSLAIPIQRIIEQAIERALRQEASFSVFSKEIDRPLLEHMAYGIVEAVCWTVNQHESEEAASTWKREALRAWAAAHRADARCVTMMEQFEELLDRCEDAEGQLQLQGRVRS
ncbi:hypothetical protein V8E36_000664 [Tilletia maclaganii]